MTARSEPPGRRFRQATEHTLYRGGIITVGVGKFVSPTGESFERDVVHHPGAVSVVPVIGDEVVMVRQYRAAIDGDLLEIPAGKRDVEGEAPEVTADRELREEVGLAPGRLVELGRFYNSPGFSDEFSITYLGLDLTEVPSSAQGVEEQYMTIERVALDDVPGLIASGEMVDAKSMIGLLLALRHLGR